MSNEMKDLSELIVGNNLIILNQEQISFFSFKNRFNLGDNYINLKNNMYTYSDFVRLYNRTNNQKMSDSDYYYFKHKFYYYLKKMISKIKNLNK
jgi:hypothetical protein